MAALPETMEDLSAPAGGEGVSTPRLDASGDVKMGGLPTEPKAGSSTGAPGGGKKKKKGKK